MMEAESRMLKGFVTAASLSSEDIEAMDKSVSELEFSVPVPGMEKAKELTPFICH